MDPDDASRVAAIRATAARLRVDHAGADAVRRLELAGIPSVLLKGASVARWLYEPEDARTYADCDLLVPPDRFDAAVRVLAEQGFEPELDEARMPSWWREHALTMINRAAGALVDLHRNLPGVQASDAQLWSVLSASSEEITLGERKARMLSEPGRLVHVALHAAQHGGTPRDLDVLNRALVRCEERAWRQAAELAQTLGAEAAFLRGLSMVPAGARLARSLPLTAAASVEVELRASRATEALTLERLRQTKGLTARGALIGRKLFPPATFMRGWSALARRGRLGLALAYLYRPVWIARRTPRAISDWSRARRRLADAVEDWGDGDRPRSGR